MKGGLGDGWRGRQKDVQLRPDWTLMRCGSGTCPEVCGVVFSVLQFTVR
jgi:hypothetical protein